MEQNKFLFQLAKKNKWNEFVEYLKDNEDIDVNIRDNGDNYLINFAIISNNKDAVSLLIHRGSRLDITDSDGRSILFNPVKYNLTNILQLLLHFNKTNIGISLVDIKDKNDNIPLHYAIKFKNIEAIDLLLENGSDVNSSDKYGNNSLHLAVYTKDTNICEMIIKNNINIDAKTKTGENALHIAANFELFDICKLLVRYNINLNTQDFDHEFIPLHYSINLNNFEISKFLIESGSDINLQDFLGNMSLHYSIIEENYQLLPFLVNSEFTSKKINFNLFNIDNKIPAHLFFEKINENDRIDELIAAFIERSNLNFQDKFGTTPLHIICSKNIWKKFKKDLQFKKLNVFIVNKNDKKPIDFIQKSDIKEFMEMVANSYLYLLKNTNFMWQEKWENECAKNGNNKKCLDLINKKLNDIVFNKNQKCNYTSYPIKINKKCFSLSDDSTIEYCTFTGITLDVLIGLIYLLRKHKKSCSTLSTNFIDNKDLCNYYRSIGISTDTRCEFLNFEIVWVYHKLFFSDNFSNNFEKCVNNKKIRFIIIPLGIELRQGSHANYLIYDKKTMEIERFEPYGSNAPYNFDYNPGLLDNILKYQFIKINKNISYVKPSEFMPKIGFQFFDIIESKNKKIGDPEGFCALWSIWYTDMRITYEDINRTSLVKKMIKNIKMRNISFKNLIRNYSKEITLIRDTVLKNANININDWLNDQYDEKQIITVVNELKKLISPFV